MHTCVCFQTVIKFKISTYWRFKFKDFQVLSSTLSVFKHFQGPWFFLQNSTIFKDFSSTLWTLQQTEVVLAFKATAVVILVAIWTTSSSQLRLVGAVRIVTFTFLCVTQHRKCIADCCKYHTEHIQQTINVETCAFCSVHNQSVSFFQGWNSNSPIEVHGSIVL